VELKRVLDGAVCLAIVLVLVGVVGDSGAEQPWRAIGMVAGLAQGIALWWRRSRPEPVMVVALAGGVIVQVVADDGIFPFAALVALGSLTYRRPPRISVPAAVATLGVTALAYAGDARTEDVSFAMAFPVVVWAVAEALRNRREAIASAAARAAGEEQARLARELHDVIAHSLSVIVVQASAADDVFEARPDQARAALRSIEGAGREALGELRRLLAGEQPGLDRLAELAEPLRAAGLEVEIVVDAGASPGVEGSAYRIVQEALTNTLRHARATRAEVTVRAAEGALELAVRDDGRGGAFDDGAGRGIAGMRERAALLGGTLDVGPRPEGGFQVHARLPDASATSRRPAGSFAPRANTPGETSPQGGASP
jgi:signal transduction histidine kinase